MTVSLPTTQAPQTQDLLQTIAAILGVSMTLLQNNFKLTLVGSPDGQDLWAQLIPGEGGPSQIEKTIQGSRLTTPATVGAEDANITSGNATMVGSTIAVTVPGGVPSGSTILATVTTPGGVTALLSAVRTDANTITISSPGSGYGALLESAGVSGALTSGVLASAALANVAGDRLVAVQTATGGTPGASWICESVDSAHVKVTSLTAGHAVQTLDTGTVKAYNFGQAATETSICRWVVVRP